MCNGFIMWLLALLLVPIMTTSCQPTEHIISKEEQLADTILANANDRMEAHWVKLREIFLSSGKPNFKPHYLMEQSVKEYRNFTVSLAQNLSDLLIYYPKFQNENLKRRVKLLSHLKIDGLNEKDYHTSQLLLENMRNLSLNKVVCSFDNCHNYVAYFPTINNAIVRTKDDNELLHYWRLWRNAVGKDAKKDFLEYIELYKKAASLNGHTTPSKTWYLDFEEDNFLQELTSAMEELQPLYKEFHAFMRFVYHQYYGPDLVPADGYISDHFMEQIILHAWKAQSLFRPPYPNDLLPNINKKIEDSKLTSTIALKTAETFYGSMGLQDLPRDFWSKYAKQMTEQEAGPDCRAEVFSFKPDVAIKYCPKVDYKKLLQLHGSMAEIQYNIYRHRLPFGLDGEAFSGIGSAIGEAVIVATSSHRHLIALRLMSAYNQNVAFNRLFRMGVHTIFTLPRYYVSEKFFVDALDNNNNVTPNNLNCAFWKIKKNFAGVAPPEERGEEHFDPGYKFYRGVDDRSPTTSKIISELLGYQFYRALCIKSGQYNPDNPENPLHNCDFYQSKEAGKALSEMMSAGSVKHWRDAIEILTGERRITATALLEYYEPLYEWLKKQNEANGVKVGWDKDDTSC